MRWRHPTQGLIDPGDFIPIAEDTEMIVLIGRQVLTQACRQMVAWQKRFGKAAPRVVCVNVSSKQFGDDDLISEVQSVLEESWLDPSHLKLEITENLHSLVRTDSVASIETEGLVGGTYLSIATGTEQSPRAPENSTIPSQEPFEIADLLHLSLGELAEGLATVRALVQAQQAGQAAAQKNSHTVGKDWEDTVAEAVASWSQASGDVVEHVGTRPAPGSSTRKSGDVLVRVMTGTRPVLIVEAKRRQKALTMRQYRDELAEARRIRRAHAALAIVPTPEGVPGPGRWARVDANSWVVAADDYGLVNLVLAVVRELAIVSAAGNDGNTAVNLGQAQAAIGHALDLLARFDDLTKQV